MLNLGRGLEEPAEWPLPYGLPGALSRAKSRDCRRGRGSDSPTGCCSASGRYCILGFSSGSNSAVECDLAKVEVAGSNPVSRSKFNPQGLVV